MLKSLPIAFEWSKEYCLYYGKCHSTSKVKGVYLLLRHMAFGCNQQEKDESLGQSLYELN